MSFKAGLNGGISPVTPDESFRPGMVAMTAATAAPSGFLMCDGSEYDPLVEPALFVAIGTAYNTGGETPGFFRVPAFQARTPFGVGTNGGQVWVRGTQAGSEALAQHNHGITDIGHNHSQNAHAHPLTDVGHNHTQNAHTHTVTDPGHNHTQNSHNHGGVTATDGQHVHRVAAFGVDVINFGSGGITGGYDFNPDTTNIGTAAIIAEANLGGFNSAHAHAINAATATNISNTTGITNANATATNNTAVTGATIDAFTASNIANTTGITVNNAGTGSSGNIPPGLGINFIIKT